MSEDLAREVWKLMSELVLDHQRRREVSEAVGLSFARTRAVRRVAAQPMSMGELAALLGIDRPNATVLVDELEGQGSSAGARIRRTGGPSWSRPQRRASGSPSAPTRSSTRPPQR